MSADRTSPLIALLFLGAAVLLARAYQVQIVEHSVWADEAKRLVHSGREIPYRRGRILDTKGRVLARDKETHRLGLVYRDFRRGHPLGQLAHARSLLEARPVPLAEAAPFLYEWADQLVHLTPRALDAFADGAALEVGALVLPATATPREEGRRRRVLDLGFYVRRLVSTDERERLAIERLARDDGKDRTFLELATLVSPASRRPTEAQVWARLVDRIERATFQLERLAELLPWPEEDGQPSTLTPVERLIAEVEETRRWVEDATAAKLFAEATGFAPGRIEPNTLYASIDLAWIARPLGWDEPRLREWMETTRRGWRTSWRDGYALPRLMTQLAIDPSQKPRPDDVLARAAATFLAGNAVEAVLGGDPIEWDDELDLAVLSQLDGLFAGRSSSSPRGAVLPIEREELVAQRAELTAADVEHERAQTERRLAAAQLSDKRRARRELEIVQLDERHDARTWRLIDAAWGGDGVAPVSAESDADAEASRGNRMRALLASRRWDASDLVLDMAIELVDEWDVGFQHAVRETLEERMATAKAGSLSPEGRLIIAEENRDRAVERAEFFLKDYGRRPRPLMREEPSYDVIYLLTRYHDDYAGFEAREAREREYPILAGDTARVARGIIGDVTSIGIDDVLLQREAAQRMRALKRMPDKSETETHELESLVGTVLLHDEVKGVAGVEGFWNQDLIGRNGYYESQGLEDVFGVGRDQTEVSRTENGRDVVLTLDTDLQRAGRRALRSKAGLEDDLADHDWYRAPVGAMVLLSIDGDVLVAASEPNEESVIADEASKQRRLIIDRTTQIPTFQPPGSVFKPFVAAYALSEAGLDPRSSLVCEPLPDGHAGYVDVHCHKRWGHGPVSLETAIMGSCNSYFAWLGELLNEDEIRAAARAFGFEERTGIRTPPPWDDGLRERGGLHERAGHVRSRDLGPLSDHDRRLLGNGLGALDTTPLQLARGVLALATGELTDLRLVRRIGTEELPLAARRPLEVDEHAVEFVRAAMRGVTNSDYASRTGRVLGVEHMGFTVAAKTGSADFTSTNAPGRRVVRKHTWVGGWAPAEDPKVVFVIFVHDTLATSSHGAIYLAREFLLQPEILAYLADQGVDVSQVPAR